MGSRQQCYRLIPHQHVCSSDYPKDLADLENIERAQSSQGHSKPRIGLLQLCKRRCGFQLRVQFHACEELFWLMCLICILNPVGCSLHQNPAKSDPHHHILVTCPKYCLRNHNKRWSPICDPEQENFVKKSGQTHTCFVLFGQDRLSKTAFAWWADVQRNYCKTFPVYITILVAHFHSSCSWTKLPKIFVHTRYIKDSDYPSIYKSVDCLVSGVSAFCVVALWARVRV